jgi:1,5-anhydro-D-fructose reductase (1,5-anhydro-D-mannitol-forming)
MTVRWGIIGCGDVCERKSGPGFQKAEGSRLVAVMRRDRALAEDFARRHGVARFYDDADALVADPEVDAVYVATPPGSHLEHALRACRAGKPAYVEKPMARSHAECLEMIRAFERARVPLFVAYYRRALARFRAARDAIVSGRIGQVTGVTYRYAAPHHRGLDPASPPWRLLAEQAGGGLLLDLGSHTIDIIDFMLGPLKVVEGLAANCASRCDVEDTVAMSFLTAGGVPGTAHWSFAAGVLVDAMEVTGTEGRVSLGTFSDAPLEVTAHGETQALAIANPEHIQQPLIQTIVDALEGKGECPSTAPSAARASAVMDEVLVSYYGRRDGEFWRDPDRWPGRRAARLRPPVVPSASSDSTGRPP